MNYTGISSDRRIIRTKRALIEAFLELLKEHDYNDISVNDILELSGYSKPTFYNHYSGKADFVDKIMNEAIYYLDKVDKEFTSEHPNETWDRDEIREYIEARFNVIYKEKELYKAFFTYPCFKLFPLMLQDYIDKLTHHQFKIFPFAPYYDYDYFSYCISYCFVATLSYWIKHNYAYSPNKIAELYTELFYSSLH